LVTSELISARGEVVGRPLWTFGSPNGLLEKRAKSRLFGPCLWANPTVQQDRGYGVTSALALVVEAVEALHVPLRL
jgi:hypothetical protein